MPNTSELQDKIFSQEVIDKVIEETEESDELLNAIVIYSFWFKYPKCFQETSVSQSIPLCYNTIQECPNCKGKFMVEQLKEEPEIILSEENYN